jgi:hypothetical protein
MMAGVGGDVDLRSLKGCLLLPQIFYLGALVTSSFVVGEVLDVFVAEEPLMPQGPVRAKRLLNEPVPIR